MTASAPERTPPWQPARPLGGTESLSSDVLDVVVVGAGLTGCSTALHLAERRPELAVALLDAGYPGSGASGRGTGLLGPRLGPPVDVARRRLGADTARLLHERSERAVELVLALAERWAPETVTPSAGQLIPATTAAERRTVHRRARVYAELDLGVSLVDAGPCAGPADPSAPALLFPTAAGVDPAALTRGLAGAARRGGVRLGEQIAVAAVVPGGCGLTRVETSAGTLRARAVVVAVDAAAPGLPLATGGMLGLEVCAQATAPLPADLLAELGGPQSAHVLSPRDLGAYRRITADGRLIIGGGPVTPWHGLGPAGLDRFRRRAGEWQRRWLLALHADLAHVPIEHRWSGRITVTRDGLPVLGRAAGPGEIWYAGGWNGHGLAATVAAGERLAESVLDGNHPPAPADALWHPGRSWALTSPRLQPAIRHYLATQVPRLPRGVDSSPSVKAVSEDVPSDTGRGGGRHMSLTATIRRPLERVEASLSLPTGRLGTAVGHAMSIQHRSLTKWALRQLVFAPDADVLDVGCGSGMALRLMSERTATGRLAGIDLSPEMVAMSRRRNAHVGPRLDVRQGDAMRLPFDEATFDVVTAIETFYFWPDPMRGLTECRRVLRPGGWLCVTLEMTRDAAEVPTLLQRVFGRSFTDRSDAGGLRIVSGTQLSAMVTEAGFTRVRFAVEPRRSLGWLCVMGQVPSQG